MSNKSFSRSIGGSHGSAPINTTSVNRNQASGSAVGGYGKPKETMSEAASDRVAPEDGCGGPKK